MRTILPEAGDFELLLNDAQGRLVRNLRVHHTAAFTEEISLTGLPAGVYTFTLSGKQGSLTRKVVKR